MYKFDFTVETDKPSLRASLYFNSLFSVTSLIQSDPNNYLLGQFMCESREW